MGGDDKVELTARDQEVLRTLAKQWSEIAVLPEMGKRRDLWYKLNRLNMERPMVLIDQVCWHEMDVDGFLKCEVNDPYFRGVEAQMRRAIYEWKHMPVDMVFNPYLCLPRPVTNSGWGIDAEVDRLLNDNTSDVASQHMHNQIHGDEDIDRIQMPVITLDKGREAEIRQQADALFAGITDYKMTGISMHLGIWDTISMWMGVTDCYLELVDRPEMIHRMMEKLTAGLLSMIDQMNAQGLFDVYSNMCHCSHTFSDDLPPKECNLEHPKSTDAWAFGLAQLFTSVSPQITDEFEVAYMQRVFPKFGAIYYGCCDRLDDRMDVIAKLPNIRKLSCSPWSECETFAEMMPGHCVMSNKPTPAFLATGALDEGLVRADIRRTVTAAKAHNRNLELILKDISTVNYDPQKLWRWAEIAMEEVQR